MTNPPKPATMCSICNKLGHHSTDNACEPQSFEERVVPAARNCEARKDGDCLSQLTQPGTKYGEHIYVFCECAVIEGFQQGAQFARTILTEEHAKDVAELESIVSELEGAIKKCKRKTATHLDWNPFVEIDEALARLKEFRKERK